MRKQNKNTNANYHSGKADSDILGILDALKSLSFNSIKNPSKSSGLDLSLSKIENDFNNAPGLACGILSQTIENILSLGNFDGSVKCLSFVTSTLCSDLENAANLPLESPFGSDIMSNPRWVRNTSNLFFTFSSLRNLTNRDGELDIVSASCEVCGILKGCQDVFSSNSWMVLEDFFNAHSSMKHFKNLPDHNSSSLESRGSTADFAVCYNILVDFDSHGSYDRKSVYKFFASDEVNQQTAIDGIEKVNGSVIVRLG